MDRRGLLRTLAGALAVGGLAGCSGGGGEASTETTAPATTAAETLRPRSTTTSGGRFGAWFANTANYEEVADRTGQSEATVQVGASGNGGNLAYEPAAVVVDSGTTVVWEWTGDGGQHNVVDREDEFESTLTEAAGHTFEYTVSTPGTRLYFCVPHRSVGMRGAVVVEEN
jgi:halocyanin-like protein